MKRYKIVIFISLGIAISFAVQNFFNEQAIANNIEENISDTISNQKAYPDFVDAANKAIKSVVHIKSIYTSNEVYRYFDPFMDKDTINNQKKILQVALELLPPKTDILLQINMSSTMLKKLKLFYMIKEHILQLLLVKIQKVI